MGQSMPNTTITTSSASQVLGLGSRKALIVGQMLTGTATAGEITDNIANTGAEDTLFGAKSQVAAMVRAFKEENKNTRLDVLALEDGAGTKAVKTLAFTGTASADGSYDLYINAHKYTLAVTSGDTAAVVGAALETLINADTQAQWTSTDTTGSLAITAENFGTIATTNINIKVVGTVAGLTFTITATTPGATDPTVDAALLSSTIGNRRYNTIIFPIQYTSTVFTTFLETRFAINNALLAGTCITAKVDAKADHISGGGSTLNKRTLGYIALKEISESAWVGSDAMEAEYEIASRVGALKELRLTDGADLTGKVIAGDRPLDLVGGAALSSKPYFNTPLNIDVLDDVNTWSIDDVDDLKDAQCIVIHNNDAGNAVILDEYYTTYATDSAGNTDITYSYQEFVDTILASTEFIFTNLKARYSQTRLVDGQARDGQTDSAKIKSYIGSLFDELAGDDYLCLDASEKKNFMDELTITTSKAGRSATITGILPIVSQLATITASFQIEL